MRFKGKSSQQNLSIFSHPNTVLAGLTLLLLIICIVWKMVAQSKKKNPKRNAVKMMRIEAPLLKEQKYVVDV